MSSCISQRRTALLLNVNKNTVEKKFHFVAQFCKDKNIEFNEDYTKNKCTEVFTDEMEDRVHTKCKPVAIALMVTPDRKILGHTVSSIKPKNKKLREICHKKYPEWRDHSRKNFKALLERMVPLFESHVKIISDEKPMYSQEIKKIFTHATHERHKSRRATVAGQGELKEGGFDPLFPLNHTCAMLRANINRLIRRSWCTSKKLENLSKHIEIYIYFHNTVLTAK